MLSFRQMGKTTLVTTHYMHEAELLCDRIVILNHGVVIATGAPRELIAREAPGYVGIFAPDGETLLRAHMQEGWDLFHQGRQCCIRAPGIEDLMALQQASGTQALQIRPSNLEDVYLKLTGRGLADNE
jgi:lipooligosaccharide transport system ATP-binding protein